MEATGKAVGKERGEVGQPEVRGAARVLHVTTVHDPLDPRIFYREASELAKTGWIVDLATTVAKKCKVEDVTLLPVGEIKASRFSRIPRNWRALRHMLRPYDIVHIHDPELLFAAAIARLMGRHVVYDVHEFYHHRFSHDEWIPRFLRPIVSGGYALAEAVILPHLAGIVVVSDAMIPRYARYVGADKVALVSNFPSVDAQTITRLRQLPRPIAKEYIVHTGAASPNRLFHIVVEMARLLRSRGIDTPIVNVGPIELEGYGRWKKAELLDAAEANDVRLLGLLPYEEAMRWLAHAKVGYIPLLNVSRNREALPVKLFEYFAFGLPIVASRLEAIAKVLDVEQAGILVDETPEAHADAFEKILCNEPLRQSLSSHALSAASRYALNGEVSKLLRLYDQVIEQDPAKRIKATRQGQADR